MTSQQGGRRQPAGIRDVARLAGVSVASVSFALNGQPGVADDTRQRGRSTTYGLVIRNFSNPFFLEVLTGAERAASDAGATLLLTIRPDPVLVSADAEPVAAAAGEEA